MENDTGDIRTKDLIAMVFLKTKYWGLFRDIEANRDLYTQIRPSDMRFGLLYDDEKEQAYRKRHFDGLFERLGYGEKEIDLLQPLLSEVFPGWNGRSHIQDDDLRAEKRIGHRDLLDLYFSYGISQEEFNRHMAQVKPIIDRVTKSKYSETSLTNRFREFNRYALKQEQAGDAARILARRLLRLHNDGGDVPVVVWRCWLHALLQYESGSNELTNAILASILSGANDSIIRSVRSNSPPAGDTASIIDHRVDDARELFKDIKSHIKDPYLVLLLLLFVWPPRGNGFFLDYINRHGVEELYTPLLSYVDQYFIVQKRNVFEEYKWPTWAFLLHQWSFSIAQGVINDGIPDAEKRRRKVNDYVFKLLKDDPKLTYQFIKEQFWKEDLTYPFGERSGWQIASNIAQYNTKEDRDHINRIAKKAMTSKALKKDQIEDLKDFIAAFSKFESANPLS